MNRQPDAPRPDGTGRELATVLGDVRYRRAIATLLERSRPVSVRELAVHIAAFDKDVQPSELADETVQSVVNDLEHRCLPKLDAMGMVERDRQGVVIADPLPTDTTLSLPSLRDPADPDWEPISALLGDPLRQAVVSVLAEASQRLGVAVLTAELHTQPQFGQEEVPDDEAVQIRLHHLTLPKLSTVDLAAYDPSARTVARTERTVRIARRTGLDSPTDGVASG